MNWDASVAGNCLASAAKVVYGPLSTWVGAGATLLVVTATVLVATGFFDSFRAPRLRLSFLPDEPWCRSGSTRDGSQVLWVRIGVENVGNRPAHGCIGRLNEVVTNGKPRPDMDPVQLRWAGVPRSRAFHAMDLRRGQREYLNVLCLETRSHWHLVTFEDPDFDPGFAVDLPLSECHVLQISVYSDNAATTTAQLVAEASKEGGATTLRLA